MKKLFVLSALLLLLLASCDGTESAFRVTSQDFDRSAATGALGAKGEGGFGAAPAVSVTDRRIIRTANLSLAVDKVSETVEAVTKMAGELGGFVVSSSRQGEEVGGTASITIRVESGKFDQALSRLRGLAVRVESENTSGQDVTEEFVDLQAQLRNLEATEAQFVKLLDRAQTVEDVLKVQQALSEVRGRIESLKGRIQFLERSSDLALISVSLRPATSPEPILREGWSATETIKDALRSLSSFGQSFAGFSLWLGVWTPVWLPLLLILFFLGSWLRRKMG
ncbi:MAG: DUF4349 domain-containing protein [Chloroflexota bacterium]